MTGISPDQTFIRRARELGVDPLLIDDEAAQAAVAPAIEFAGMGSKVLHGYMVAAEQNLTSPVAERQYALLLRAAADTIGQDVAGPLRTEADRLGDE